MGCTKWAPTRDVRRALWLALASDSAACLAHVLLLRAVKAVAAHAGLAKDAFVCAVGAEGATRRAPLVACSRPAT